MRIHLTITLEQTDSGDWVWWAESADLPGFYAAEAALEPLITRARLAVTEILGEDTFPEFEYAVRQPEETSTRVRTEVHFEPVA